MKNNWIRLGKGLLLSAIISLSITLICSFIALTIGDPERFEFKVGFIAGSAYWITLFTYMFYKEINKKES